MKTLLLVGLGSFVGGALRYAAYLCANAIGWRSAVATFVVNVLGCLVLGFVAGTLDKGSTLSHDMRSFLTFGVCGGFTTYSTFMNDGFRMLREGAFTPALLYVAASLVVGFLLLYVGYFLGCRAKT